MQKKAFQNKLGPLVDIIFIWVIMLLIIMSHVTIGWASTIYVGAGEEYTTIQPAIDDAVDGDTVIVKDGTYKGAGNKNLDFKGKAITIKSENGAENTIIDCEQSDRGFYFHLLETDASKVDGFTIQNGDMNVGGGIFCSYSSPAIVNCVISGNSSNYFGGGIYCYYSSLKITNCTISNNKVKQYPGGGNGGGGGINCNYSSPTITNCIISGNSAVRYGGGISCYDSSPTIINCTITGNKTEKYSGYDGGGGGISCCNNSSPIITNCTIGENSTVDSGGGIYCYNYSSPKISSCTISRNSGAESGGGISCESSWPTISNCTISGNSSNTWGGGIYWSYCSPTITNCTIIDNSANFGGGIFCQKSYPTITNCIGWNNSPNSITVYEGSPIVTYCNIQHGYDGTGNINADPQFVDPTNGDYRLSSGSPCIDSGTNIGWLYSDQRASLRPINGSDSVNVNNNFDIGAFEYSKYYGGSNDAVVKAFQEIKLIGYYGLINYYNLIQWKSTGPFPDNDERITPIYGGSKNPYEVKLALVAENGRRIDLTEINVSTTTDNITPEGYKWSHSTLFSQEHLGDWKIRIEMADDPQQYTISEDWITIKEAEAEIWIIGQEILPPEYADTSKEPDIEDEAEYAFFWSDYAQKLYAVAPITTTVIWKDADDISIPVLGTNIWPENPQIHVEDSPPVDLLPEASSYRYFEIKYSEAGAVVDATNKFTAMATGEGHSVLAYWEDDQQNSAPIFEVIRTVLWNNPDILNEMTWNIGQKVTDSSHEDECGGGYVFFEIAPYHGGVYARNTETRSGPIIPVNKDDPGKPEDDLVVIWYQKGVTGACWPFKPVHYDCQWPQYPEKIIIASLLGSGDLPESYNEIQVYVQPDVNLPGYNPNEEHALIMPGPPARVYALRNDLNRSDTSEPYVLLKYQDSLNNNEWTINVYKVITEENPYFFNYEGKVGTLIQTPYPLSLLQLCMESYFDSGPWWEDYNGNLYAKKPGMGVYYYYYPLQENFFYDLDGDGLPDADHGDCIPWLDRRPGGTPGIPIDITYTITWPDDIPKLHVGETLLTPKNELPAITTQCSVEIIYDQSLEEHGSPSVKLIDPLRQIEVDLIELPPEIKVQSKGGVKIFSDLAFHLRTRLSFDPLNGKLKFKGHFDDSGVGEPLLLPNILIERELNQLYALSNDTNYRTAVYALYSLSREQLTGQTKLIEGDKALTAGAATGTGYVTLVFAGDEACDPNPVSLSVIEVVCPLYTGEIKVIEPDNVFDERVTMRHNADFGGEPQDRIFEWKYSTSIDKPEIPDIEPEKWLVYIPEPHDGQGAVDITIGGAGLQTLTDKWVTCRYKGYDVCGQEIFSEWTEPQLYEGWIKRVMRSINLFEQRCKNFHEPDTEVNTFASMLIQAGERYEGDVAFTNDPENLNNMGLIQLYETVLNHGSKLSIDGTPSVDDPGANNALLLAAGRIADLYMLLGNEAYADATDPTIGFGTDDGIYGSEAPSIFCFQNQVDSLLDEELDLLRGRDDTRASVDIRPLYNRLPWNYTSGQDGGEVAYSLNYNIEDQNDDGIVDEKDAMIMFPQGHGDAWGHYLTAIKAYYNLLRHPNYTWVPRAESVLVAGLPVEVDYLDERKFARAAAARGKCGLEIINLTYRGHYIEEPYGQWQGYKDTEPDRSWGVSEWACRAGQGIYLDWAVANALLPFEDTDPDHTGIKKIDRITVSELRDIASFFQEIQSTLNNADIGLNPIGFAKDALPFDITPTEIDQGKTHFEQIYERAVQALNNAIAVFNHANQMTQLLRRQQDTLGDFQQNVEEREADFNNRLIEIFGYPYPEDCGSSGAYPSEYDGPDIYHFMYVDTSLSTEHEFMLKVSNDTVIEDGTLNREIKNIPFHISTDLHKFVKPKLWTDQRRAPGELQMALSELLQSTARFEEGLIKYNNLLAQVEDQAKLIKAQHNLNTSEINILNETLGQQQSLNTAIMEARSRQIDFRTKGRMATLIANAIAEGFPKQTGFIAGLACGAIFDWTFGLRAAVLLAGSVTNEIMNRNADRESLAELEHQQSKERVQSLSNIKLTTIRSEFAIQQQVTQLTQLIRNEASLRLELYLLQENMQQFERRYLAALAKGERLLEDRLRFRHQTAGQIQNYRYKDMAFRIFRNDALQKYRAQFDMAAMYVYLAARAYDYETSLLDSSSLAGQAFLTDIVRQRTIGLINSGQPITGTGLADPMARLSQNFSILKGQLGFNNPQTETNQFSLRREHFRIGVSEDSDAAWKEVLEQHRVANLWDIPEFKRYCKPFTTEEDGRQPALVIPLETNISFGLNFFGWPLGGGDSYYASENFATRIRSVGTWFSNYNSLSGSGLAETPRIYLIPVGADILRAPSDDALTTREWQIVDQILPVPFPLGASGDWTSNQNWIPIIDTLSEVLAGIRRHPRFRAYHDSGLNTVEMAYDSRLIGRSVWNTRWLLIIPSASLYWDPENPEEGLDTFINGPLIPGGDGERTGYGVTDIKIFFQTYAYQGY